MVSLKEKEYGRFTRPQHHWGMDGFKIKQQGKILKSNANQYVYYFVCILQQMNKLN